MQGEDASIEAAVMAISNCLREPVGPNNCSEIKWGATAVVKYVITPVIVSILKFISCTNCVIKLVILNLYLRTSIIQQ